MSDDITRKIQQPDETRSSVPYTPKPQPTPPPSKSDDSK